MMNWFVNLTQNLDGRIVYVLFWVIILLGIVKERPSKYLVRYKQRVAPCINETDIAVDDGIWVKNAIVKICAVSFLPVLTLGFIYFLRGEGIQFLRMFWLVFCGAVGVIFHNKPKHTKYVFEWMMIIGLTPSLMASNWMRNRSTVEFFRLREPYIIQTSITSNSK